MFLDISETLRPKYAILTEYWFGFLIGLDIYLILLFYPVKVFGQVTTTLPPKNTILYNFFYFFLFKTKIDSVGWGCLTFSTQPQAPLIAS